MSLPPARRFLRCLVAGVTYGLEMAWVGGIVSLEALREPAPEDAPACLGRIQHDNTSLAVFALEGLLHGTVPAGPLTGEIVALQLAAHSYAILVPAFESMVSIAPEALFPLPLAARSQQNPFFEGVVLLQEHLWLVLSPQGLQPDVHKRLALVPQAPVVPSLPAIPPIKTRKLLMFTNPAASQPAYIFALSLLQVVQIVVASPLVAVPGITGSLLGLMPWRGVPLAMVDLSHCLGGAAGAPPIRRILVARATATVTFLGFPIHHETRIYALPLPHHPQKCPEPLQQSLLRGVFTVKHSTIVIPDIDAIVALASPPHRLPQQDADGRGPGPYGIG